MLLALTSFGFGGASSRATELKCGRELLLLVPDREQSELSSEEIAAAIQARLACMSAVATAVCRMPVQAIDSRIRPRPFNTYSHGRDVDLFDIRAGPVEFKRSGCLNGALSIPARSAGSMLPRDANER